MDLSGIPVTYGSVAQERRTHTPIVFDPALKNGDEGSWDVDIPSLLKAISFGSGIFNSYDNNGMIRINPDPPSKIPVPNTIRHEAIHSVLLKRIGAAKAREAASQTPGFSALSKQLDNFGRGYNPQDEVPAYAGGGQIPLEGAPQYMQELVGKLLKIDPSAARLIQQLSQGPTNTVNY